MNQDTLELRYIPLAQAQLWDANPKRHDLDALIRSIEQHGFGDPPKFDSKLEGLVYGNGRTEALQTMRANGQEPPRGVAVSENGEWAVPILFGVDAESRSSAVAFAVDHNNLSMLGGGLGFTDMLAVWDEEGLQKVLSDVPDAGELLISFDSDEVEALLDSPGFEPVDAGDQSRLDEKKCVTCPECGHEFTP